MVKKYELSSKDIFLFHRIPIARIYPPKVAGTARVKLPAWRLRNDDWIAGTNKRIFFITPWHALRPTQPFTAVLISPQPDPTEKNKLKFRNFSSDAVVIAAAETWLDGQTSEFFLSGLQKLEFGRCSLFPSWSGWELISTPVVNGQRGFLLSGKAKGTWSWPLFLQFLLHNLQTCLCSVLIPNFASTSLIFVKVSYVLEHLKWGNRRQLEKTKA